MIYTCCDELRRAALGEERHSGVGWSRAFLAKAVLAQRTCPHPDWVPVPVSEAEAEELQRIVDEAGV